LYPDALVAQILAAATYPDQIVEADRWLQQHTDLKGEQLGKEVDKQPWDPSVKALAEFPSVLANMDKNLSWTSSLGDAYVNQQQEVMNAVQVMRDRAEKAGNLESTSQEKVTNQGQTIVIEPADPEVVYVPEYDPWLVYGEPIGIWPGWYSYPGLFLAGPGIALGVAPLGIRLASPQCHLQPQHVHLPQQSFRQSQQLQSRRGISWRKRISRRRTEQRFRRRPAWIHRAACPARQPLRRVRRI
jgi:hypothetical protein